MAPVSSGPRGGKRVEIEIDIPVRPTFVPGNTPKQPRISLLPANDATAFIIDKVIQPPTAVLDKEVQRQLCYIIGWRDVPAVRVMISCAKVMEYVSPLELEQWEYQDQLRREEEEWQKAIEEVKLASMGDVQPQPELQGSTQGPKGKKGKKRRGRPPRAALMDERPPTPVLDAEDEKWIAKKKAAAPSLSTPQKMRLQQLMIEEEEYDDSDVATAIHRQLYEDMDLDPDADASDLAPAGDGVSELEEEMGTEKETWESSRDSSAVPPLPQLPGTSSPLRGIKAFQQLSVTSSLMKRKRSLEPAPIIPEVRRNRRESSTTPAAAAASSPHASLKPPPAKTPKLSHYLAKGKNPVSGSRGGTPGSSRAQPSIANGTSRSSPRPLSFTPIAKSSGTWPRESPEAPPTTESVQVEPEREKSSVKSTKKKGKQPMPSGEGVPAERVEDQGWEVKRLEGDRLVEDANGTVVRYYKVRWKGDWPPDQNPTWEPEENITKALVKKYLKKKEARASSSSTPTKTRNKQQTLSPWMGKKKYASVSEAFEDADDSVMMPTEASQLEEEADELDDDEFKVTEGDVPVSDRHSLDIDLARQFAQMSRAGSFR